MTGEQYTAPPTDIPGGHCQCGCGAKTRIARQNKPKFGHIAGEPLRFLRGHGSRVRPKRDLGDLYVEDTETGCWIWSGGTSHGYGSLRVDGKHRPAHCVYYERLKSAIPGGMVLDHKCRTTLCVNPDHLDPVPQRINVRRGLRTKLIAFQVYQIRRLHRVGHDKAAIAKAYGVSLSHVNKIIYRQKWSDVG